MTIGYRILHLSDFHWDMETAEDQKLIVEKFKTDLESIVNNRRIDIVVFSGDLVAKGQEPSSFKAASELLFESIQRSFGLSNSDIIICPGNHDVDRKLATEQTYTEAGLSATLKDSDTLNRHIDRYIANLGPDAANARLENYFSFIRPRFNQSASFTSNYVDCVMKKADFGEIGFALFNSAWRSTGAGDGERNQLLLAERVVDKAAEQLKACDLKIAVLHHPLDWLARWSEAAVRNLLLANFDLVLFGHVHETMPSLVANTLGECLFAQGGTLYLHRKYYNGYQMIDITESEGFNFDFHLRTWFDYPRRAFGPAENICAGGKKTYRIRSNLDAPKTLRIGELLAYQAATDEMADAHSKTLQLKNAATFDESFICPPLSEKTEEELLGLSPAIYKRSFIELDSLLKENGVVVFSGPRESGKTTIAWKVAKDVLRATDRPVRIPIIVNFSQIKKYDALDRLVRRHVSNLNLDLPSAKILHGHRCLFIVDNVSLADQEKMDRLKKLMNDNNIKHDWCVFLDRIELLSSKNIVEELGATRPPIFIQPFGRGEIRALVSKISSPIIGTDNVDTIVTLINDNNLPRNPYIVTLLSSVLANVAVDSIINEAALLDKMIDLLLNKQDPSNIIRSSTDFTGLNILLEQIAQWLSAEDSSLLENELVGRLAGYLTERGIQESASAVLRHFINVGILERVGDDVSFRYRSFESYFVARYAARNKDFAPKLLDDLAILKYAKEFALLCDLSRKDADLLSYLEIIISELQPAAFEQADGSGFLKADLKGSASEIVDELLENISGGPQSLSKIDETYDVQDRARAAIARKLREIAPLSNSKSEVGEDKKRLSDLMRLTGYIEAWRCWGRAITSLDFVQISLRKPSFVELLKHWTRFASIASEAGYDFVQSLVADAKKEGKPLPDSIVHRLEYLTRVQFPLNAAQAAFANIGASSVYQVLIESFDELDLHAPETMGAVCMLIHHRPPGWIERVMKYIDVNIQKSGNDIKRYFLLEALHQEYYFRYLNPAQLGAVEAIIAELLSRAGFVDARTKDILNRIERNRPRIELLTREMRR